MEPHIYKNTFPLKLNYLNNIYLNVMRLGNPLLDHLTLS